MADLLEHWFNREAVDGFILGIGIGIGSDPQDLARFVSDVLPRLRARGLFRSDYSADTLRGHLGLAVPQNRHIVARAAARAAATAAVTADAPGAAPHAPQAISA